MAGRIGENDLPGGPGGEFVGEIIGTSSAILVEVFVFGFVFRVSLEFAFVAETLLGGPIGTGSLYLTNDEANGGVGVVDVVTF